MKTLISIVSLFIFQLSFFHTSLFGQASSAEIYQQIKKLNTFGSVLYIAAHPDDENTRLLAYLSKEKLYRTGYLSLTRGDGGQNLIGDEQGVELGLIRTQELLAARKIDGAEQFFTRAFDFGFSKTTDETLHTWDKQKVLADVVWTIRKFQPDVVIARFPPDSRAGHGHHSASAVLAREAFIAAADATQFPEQFKYGVQAWQAKRLLWNTFNFGGNNTTNENQFKIDVGVYNATIGKSYGEMAAESRSQHKSQGFGVPSQRGETFEYFLHIAGDSAAKDLMDGIDISWNKYSSNNISSEINDILNNYKISNPSESLPAIKNLYKKLIAFRPNNNLIDKKIKELEQLILNISGIFIEATTAKQQFIEGDTLAITCTINSRVAKNVKLLSGSISDIKKVQYSFNNSTDLQPNKNVAIKVNFIVNDYTTAQPYWLLKPMQPGYFDVDNQELIGKPQTDAFTASFLLQLDNEINIVVTKPVQYKHTDPVKGELFQPVIILPQVELHFQQENILAINNKKVNASLQLVNNKNNEVVYTINQKINNASFKVESASTITTLQTGNNNSTSLFLPTLPSPQSSIVFATASSANNLNYNTYHKTIQYDHIPTINYFKEAKANLVSLDIKIRGKNIGYIIGAGDKVPEALQQLGYNVIILDEKNISTDNIKNLDAIITGIRAYNVHEYLSDKYTVLMNYVQRGGNLIVQYNTNNQIGPVRAKMSPYNFTISRTRVTEENANVKFLLPDHPALNFPNTITAKDFEGWMQERSTYQAEKLDSNYSAILAMNDKGEAESNGSLITAKYGKGNFVYVSLVMFRQLPAGNVGAYRLMANLIALPKN